MHEEHDSLVDYESTIHELVEHVEDSEDKDEE